MKELKDQDKKHNEAIDSINSIEQVSVILVHYLFFYLFFFFPSRFSLRVLSAN